MSFIVGVLMLVAIDIAGAIGHVLAAGDSLSLPFVIEPLLAAASVLGSIGQSSDSLSGFGARLKVKFNFIH